MPCSLSSTGQHIEADRRSATEVGVPLPAAASVLADRWFECKTCIADPTHAGLATPCPCAMLNAGTIHREVEQMRYEAPSSVDQAVALLAGATGEARVLAGGTDLLVQMRTDLIEPALLIDIKGIAGPR